MKQNLFATLGTNFAKDKQLIKKIMSNASVFVGWVDSYNEADGTVGVQPAIQRQNIDENSVGDYVNRPFLANVKVVCNTLWRHPQRGDKVLVLVLDEKSNIFFKTAYDNTKSLQEQTFVNSSTSVKTLSNCVAIVVNYDYFPNEYKEDEIPVGMWVDGKIIYRKVIVYTEAIPNNSDIEIGNVGAVDTVTKISKTIRNSADEWWSDNYYDTQITKGLSVQVMKTGEVIIKSINENWGSPILIVVVEYTKN